MQKIKRIGAGILGTIMAGASLLAPALAADLSNYPAPFVTDGTTDFLIVVGADANPADVVGAINLAVRLGAEPGEEKTATTTGGAKTITEGIDLGLSGDLIYLGDAFSKDVITKTDLPTILADGTFTDDNGNTYSYTQLVDLSAGTATVKYKKYSTEEDPALIVDLSSTTSSSPLYTLKITFNEPVNLTATASKGQTIELFGKDYTVASETDNNKLVLYGASQSVTLNKDEETTVTVGDTEYTIKVVGFDTSADKVILTVNGNTNDVGEGASKKIGGLNIYAKSVTSWDNGNAGIAVLQVGSQKIVLENGQGVMIGDSEEEIDGTQVTLTSNPSSLSEIDIAVYNPGTENDYIKVGTGFTDPVFGAFKISFAGVSSDLTAESRDVIELSNSGDETAIIKATDKNDNTGEIEFAKASGSSVALTDSNGYVYHVVEGEDAAKTGLTKDYLFLTPGDARYTHLVQIKNIRVDNDGNSDDYVEFTDVFSGSTYKSQTFNYGSINHTSIVVDGKTYKVDVGTNTSTVSVSYNDNYKVIYPAIELANGETLAFTKPLTGLNIPNTTEIMLPTGTYTVGSNPNSTSNVTKGSLTYTITEDASGTLTAISIAGVSNPAIVILEEKDDNDVQNAIIIETTASDSKIDYESPILTASTKWEDIATENSNVRHYLDYYGTFIVKDTSDSDHTHYTIYYPDEQVYALIGLGTEVTVGGGTGTVTYEEVVPIKDNIARLDTDPEVEAAKGNKNLILVGGPAVNRLTAQVLGLDYPTYGAASTIPENAAMIKLVEDAFGGGKVALVVAGWEAANTRAACRVLQQYDEYDLSGTAVKVEGTTTPTVSALEETAPAENQTEE